MNIDIHFIYLAIFILFTSWSTTFVLLLFHNKQPGPFVIKEYRSITQLIRYNTEADTSQLKIDYLKQKAIQALCNELSEKPELFDVIVKDNYINSGFKNIEVNLRIVAPQPKL